jgi:hypothetical protein
MLGFECWIGTNAEFWMVNGGLRRSRCGGWGKFWMLDVGCWMLDVGFIQNSKLLIQNSGFWCRRGRRRSEVGWWIEDDFEFWMMDGVLN